jgi:hypothetical protein
VFSFLRTAKGCEYNRVRADAGYLLKCCVVLHGYFSYSLCCRLIELVGQQQLILSPVLLLLREKSPQIKFSRASLKHVQRDGTAAVARLMLRSCDTRASL